MSLETATYIASLVIANPDGSDQRNTADDHLRLIKACLKRSFPLVDGAISLSSVQFMYANDLSASVQLQLNQLRDGSATANNAVNSRFANSASLALYANSASYAGIAATANSASYATLAGQAASASFATLAATANSASYAALAGHANYANSASYAALAGTANTANTATSAATAGTAEVATTASNANALSGLAASTTAGGSTIAARNSSGDLFARYLNLSSSSSENPTVGSFFVEAGGDGYARKGALASVRRQIFLNCTIQADPGGTPSGSPGDVFLYF